MCRSTALVARLMSDDAGTTAIEYAMLAMVIAVALITAFTNLGTSIGTMWNSISLKVGGAG